MFREEDLPSRPPSPGTHYGITFANYLRAVVRYFLQSVAATPDRFVREVERRRELIQQDQDDILDPLTPTDSPQSPATFCFLVLGPRLILFQLLFLRTVFSSIAVPRVLPHRRFFVCT